VDLELNDEQVSLRDTVRRFLADRAPITPYVRSMFEDPRGTTDEVWKELAVLGVTGLLVPEEQGGAGLAMVDMGIVLEELGRSVHPGPLIVSAVGATRALLRLGDLDPPLLPGLADGSAIGTLALLESGYQRRWDLPATRADRVAEGFVLTGEKTDVLDAVAADVYLVVAAVQGGSDAIPGLFAVHRDAVGISVTPEPSIDGTRKRGTLHLSRTPGQMVGEPGAAALRPVIDDLLLALGSDALGAATRCLELAVDYAKVREQFGRPIGSFQAVQHMCVEIYRAVEMARGSVMFALCAADSADDDSYHRAVTIVKAAGGTLVAAAESAIQVFGGIGFTWEHDLHLFYKRLLSFEAFLGSSGGYASEAGRLYIQQVLEAE
jgi:alkylation response protein AidB-like acyl-CoA dehydrogenase